ncbi:aminodeoxychorismate lyase [Paraferrimonas sp. SM1919]|uniref:aminodeoxychorismate lyase n=1 Tax=Paraferrimonas sp. SM1919 TaxID=2662263 RepID=UPI0013D0734D|nr:aminodeoxychorismate lyase [Paraferrimonas sp. SM1919]
MVAILDADDTSISPSDRAFNYGDGCFTTIAVLNQQPLLIDKHIARLQRAVQVLSLRIDSWQHITGEINSKAAQVRQGFIKLVISRGIGGRGYQFDAAQQPVVIISAGEFPSHYPNWRRQGIALGVHHLAMGQQPLFAGIKHLNRLEQVMLRHHYQGNEVDYVCFDQDDNIICASAANLFFMKGQQVHTPKISNAGITGVMRQHMIEFLMAKGIDVQVRDINMDELSLFDNAWMTNSLMGAVSVNSITELSHFKGFQRFSLIDEFNLNLGFELC